MNEGKAIHYILSNDADVAALVGTRIYPIHLPQKNKTYPCIIYKAVSRVPTDEKDGSSQVDIIRFQITCISSEDDYAGAVDLADKVREAIDRYSGNVVVGDTTIPIDKIIYEDDVEDFDYEQELFWKATDYFVRRKRTGSIPNTGGDCDPVTILDQNGGTVTTVSAGGSYEVIVFSGIVDSGTPYSNSIVDS